LEFWTSFEAWRFAGPATEITRRRVEPFLVAAFSGSSLAALDCTLRYVPIVVPVKMRARFPVRSELRKSQKVYVCAPQLEYDVFVGGAFPLQLQEYLRGLAPAGAPLAALGATPLQIGAFAQILASAARHILSAPAVSKPPASVTRPR
jgi:hypothetical protein